MGLAASALVLYLRRPIHTIVHPALPHPDAGKCGSQRIHPSRTGHAKQEIIVDNDDNRNTTNSLYLEVKSRKAQWEKPLCLDLHNRSVSTRKEKILFMTVQPALHKLKRRKQSLCRVGSRHPGNRRICCIRFLSKPAQQRERCQIPCIP